MAGVGVFALYPGTYLTAIGAALAGQNKDDGNAVLISGIATLVAAVALGTVGGIMAYTNWTTGVSQE
jgi:hypothetical protein